MGTEVQFRFEYYELHFLVKENMKTGFEMK